MKTKFIIYVLFLRGGVVMITSARFCMQRFNLDLTRWANSSQYTICNHYAHLRKSA